MAAQHLQKHLLGMLCILQVLRMVTKFHVRTWPEKAGKAWEVRVLPAYWRKKTYQYADENFNGLVAGNVKLYGWYGPVQLSNTHGRS